MARTSGPEESRHREDPALSPDHPSKPETPGELTWPTRKYLLRNTVREFMADDCTDIAAALTYYAVLSVFPAVLALVSLLGMFGQGQRTTDAVLDVFRDLGVDAALDTIEPAISQVTTGQAAGAAFAIGVVMALWSASGYVNAFGRAMNRVYEIDEGRPAWKLRPIMMLITAILLVMAGIAGLMLVVSGPIADALGGLVGLSDLALAIWQIAKLPLLLIIATMMAAMLYHFTPNVRQPRFRWISIGAVVAILAWIVATAAFGFYVANFGSYNKTYGALGGAIVFLLWLWITNLALLFGAELDAETERGRQLQAGIRAEEKIQLPPRDTTKSEKDAAKAAKHLAEARQLREKQPHRGDP